MIDKGETQRTGTAEVAQELLSNFLISEEQERLLHSRDKKQPL